MLENLPESVFVSLCKKYENERTAVEDEVAKLEKKLSATEGIADGADEYVKKIKKYASCEALTRGMCLQLINFITIGEINGSGEREIHIYYNAAYGANP